MTFQKGIASNPAGRPPNDRALAAVLRAAMQEEIVVNGKTMTAMQYRAKMGQELLIQGQTHFYNPKTQSDDGDSLIIGPKEWLALNKDIANEIDGPIRPDGELSVYLFKAYVGVSPDDWDDKTPTIELPVQPVPQIVAPVAVQAPAVQRKRSVKRKAKAPSVAKNARSSESTGRQNARSRAAKKGVKS